VNIFYKYYKRYDAWYDRNKFAYLSEIEAIRRVLPKKGRGLEIGVGTGRFAGALKIESGIDPSKDMLRLARRRGIDAKLACGERLPFKKAVFDYAVIIITICFVNDPKRVLKEAYRVLKKNGRIIMGIVDRDGFLGRFYQKKKSIFYKNANFFTVKEVTDLLKGAGFTGFSYRQTLSKLPDRVRSMERSRKGFGRGGFVVISARKG